MTDALSGASRLNAFDGMKILQRVQADPAVARAQKQIDELKGQRDQVDVGLSLDRTGRFARYRDLADRFWQEGAATSIHREVRMTVIEGMAGLAASMASIFLGSLSAGVYLALGTCAAAVYVMPKVNAYVDRKYILPTMTDNGIKRELKEQGQTLDRRLEEARASKLKLEESVTQKLVREMEDQRAAAAARGSGIVERDDQAVKIGGLRIPVRTPSSDRDPSTNPVRPQS